MYTFGLCVLLNSTGSNLLVVSTSWLTNGLITVEHSGLYVIIYLQAVGTERQGATAPAENL